MTQLSFIRAKIEIARLMCHPLIGRLISTIYHNRIHTNGLTIDTNLSIITPEIKASLFWGIYEKAEIRFVKQYIQRDCDVIELGSSLGVVSCQICKVLDANRKLICLEANPELIEIMKLNLHVNCLEHDVIVIDKAIDYDSSRNSINLSFDSDHTGARISNGKVNAKHQWEVKTITLSNLLHSYDISEYVLVCDIEGAEAQIIDKDGLSLSKCRQIILELHDTTLDGRDISIDDMLGTLTQRLGFRLRDQHGPVLCLERP